MRLKVTRTLPDTVPTRLTASEQENMAASLAQQPCRPALCGIPNDAAGTAIATRNPVRVARTFGRLHNVFVQVGYSGWRDAIARASIADDALLDLKARTIK